MKFLKSYVKLLGREAGLDIEKLVCKFLPKNSGAVYLDCGCWDGEKTRKRGIAIGTKKVLGVEVVNKARLLAEKNDVVTYNFDLNQKWPIGSKRIDVITATEVIEHLIDLDNFFSEAKRVLKDGGGLIISTENLAGYHNIFTLLLGNQPYTGPYLSRRFSVSRGPSSEYYDKGMSGYMNPHLNVMTYKALILILKKYGFTILKDRGVGFYPLPFPFSKILPLIDKYHSSYAIVLALK